MAGTVKISCPLPEQAARPGIRSSSRLSNPSLYRPNSRANPFRYDREIGNTLGMTARGRNRDGLAELRDIEVRSTANALRTKSLRKLALSRNLSTHVAVEVFAGNLPEVET